MDRGTRRRESSTRCWSGRSDWVAKRDLVYNATRFLQLVGSKGGVDATKQLLRGPPSEGFVTWGEKGRLDLRPRSYRKLGRLNGRRSYPSPAMSRQAFSYSVPARRISERETFVRVR